MSSALPSRVGRYEIVDRLGAGGMGVVYLATDPVLRRTVAIKILPGEDDDELRERFLREARSAAALRHANVVTIYDVGEDQGRPFIAMEFIDGESMAELIRRRAPYTVERRVQLMIELCAGLGYAHRNGIVHRDIKPGNLMITTEGSLKILDFGLARFTSAGSGAGLTRVGALIGTPHYMSPEQVQGKQVDQRSDIFSVGLVLYELLTYRKAYPGESAHVVLHNIVHTDPTPFRSLMPAIDLDLARVVEKGLEKDRARRYPTLGSLATDLERVRHALREDPGDTTVIEDEDHPPTVPATPAKVPGAATPRSPFNLDVIAQRRAAQIELHLNAAEQHFAAERYEAAIEQCENAIVIDPQAPRALDLLGRAHRASEELQVRQWVAQAHALLSSDDLSGAEALLDQALKLRASSPEAQELQRELKERRREKERIAERQRAARSAFERARKHMDDGALEAAVRCASEALAYDSANLDAQSLKERALVALEERRRQREIDQAAADVADRARARADAGDLSGALDQLRGYTPAHNAVEDAIAELAERQARLRRDEERRRREEEERRKQEELERKRQEEARRRREEEDRRRQEGERRRREEEERARQKALEEQRKREEAARQRALEEQRQREAEAARQRALEKQRAEEEERARQRALEEQRKLEDQRQLEEQRKLHEQRTLDEQARRRALEEQKKREADEQARQEALAETRRQQEEQTRRERAAAERRAREESEKRAREDAEQRARDEAEKRAHAEAEKRAREETERTHRERALEEQRRREQAAAEIEDRLREQRRRDVEVSASIDEALDNDETIRIDRPPVDARSAEMVAAVEGEVQVPAADVRPGWSARQLAIAASVIVAAGLGVWVLWPRSSLDSGAAVPAPAPSLAAAPSAPAGVPSPSAQALQNARDRYQSRDIAGAVSAALSIPESSAERTPAVDLVNTIRRDAEQAAATARQSAEAAKKTGEDTFRRGAQRQDEARRLAAPAETAQAVTAFEESAALFREAAAAGLSADQLARQAEQEYAAQRVDRAIDAALQALDRSAQHPGALRVISSIRTAALERADRAAQAARKVGVSESNSPVFKEGRALEESARRMQSPKEAASALKMLDGAQSRYAAAATEFQGRLQAAELLRGHLQRADERLKAGDLAGASAAILDAERLDAGHARVAELKRNVEAVRTGQAAELQRRAEVQKAITEASGVANDNDAMKLLRDALTKYPENAEISSALTARGRARDEKVADLFKRAQATTAHGQAIEWLDQALALDPSRADVRAERERRALALSSSSGSSGSTAALVGQWERGVRDALTRYEAAYEAKNVNDLLQVASYRTRSDVETEFRVFRTIALQIENISPKVDASGATAVVTCRIRSSREPAGIRGRPITDDFTYQLQLANTGGTWRITGATRSR